MNASITEASGSDLNVQYLGNCLFILEANKLISGLKSIASRALHNSVVLISIRYPENGNV